MEASSPTIPAGRFFDDVDVGDVFWTPARTITEADVGLFAGLSGDYNALHTDRAYAETTDFGRPVAHGLLVLAIVSGLAGRLALFEGTTLALLSVDWSFHAPVFFGDTVRAEMMIAEKKESRKPDRGTVIRHFQVMNQDGVVVQRGTFATLVRRSLV